MNSKFSLQDLKDLFIYAKVAGPRKISKHQASKKGHRHSHNLSKGQTRDALKIIPAGK